MLWQMGHRHTCGANEGPLRLKGALTLNDVVYICTDVYSQLEMYRRELGSRVTAELVKDARRGAMTEAVIMIDLTQLRNDTMDVHCPYTRPVQAKQGIRPRRVLIEVLMQLGGSDVTRMLPFTLDITFFSSSPTQNARAS
ncbi:hypothetical protein BD626DRAFT_520528 [Schizophyllum amplum]|uniref:Uncharacterized protein n=1 Tax=Schizophyllum amplum TaxID=97359 RepID=A0A550BUG2_9AGAR|nr:hypothetical protein BD626DRAFT_520528 [Auriculariopsis ampla]